MRSSKVNHTPAHRRLESATRQIDVAALGLIRDRERGVPRFNEFRRQYGLRQLSGFDDFIDVRAPTQDQQAQKDLVKLLREVYGQHTCDASKVAGVEAAQRRRIRRGVQGQPEEMTV
jgi:hypothetical protein